MEIPYLRLSGWDSAIRALYMSHSSYSPDLEKKLLNAEAFENKLISERNKNAVLEPGAYFDLDASKVPEDWLWYRDQKRKVVKYGSKHITLLRFVDVSFVVTGLHRGAQDDFDSHAARFDNRIVRASSRTKDNEERTEVSDYYKGKILTFQDLIDIFKLPEDVFSNGTVYKRTALGYVAADEADNPDVRRGHCTLAFSSMFTCKCNITQWCHVLREREINGYAHPELKDMVEKVTEMIYYEESSFTRDWLLENCLQ